MEKYLKERFRELSQVTNSAEILQLPILQTHNDVDRLNAQITVDLHVLPKPSTMAASESTLILARVSPVTVPGLIIYFMDVCNGHIV